MHTLIFVEQFLKLAIGGGGRGRGGGPVLPAVHVGLEGDVEAEMLIKVPLRLP
jgi:hypothetical protein